MYNELELSEIKAKGWLKRYLQTQASGLTGEIGNVGEPFSLSTWGSEKGSKADTETFLGGINSIDDSWVPFEQNGYWIDGMIRAGRLADNQKLIEQAGKKIYPVLDNADADGYLGPTFLRDGLTWAHAVYFRALIAEYTATHDERILNGLKNHFLRRPITDNYKKKDLRIISVRNAADIETVLWVYGRTNDERFLKMAEESYAEYNRLFTDDSEADVNSEMHDVTLVGMLKNRKVQRNHGVTYCELCKLAAILYKYTGNETYKEAAVKAFDKVYRDQMLVDGVISSTEYLNGNEDSQAMHETCLVSDFTWALGYLYMITGDSKYGDWVEDAVFNGGLGSVDDDFKGNQYFSCPNQVLANDRSNHARFFRGEDWISYAPKKFLACCAGNVHRFMPNFISRAWMREGNVLSSFVYAPCEISVCINGTAVKIEEITQYPFENTVRLRISAENPTEFTLRLRKPTWAVSAKLTLNGEELNKRFTNGVCSITRVFENGDEIELSFVDEIRLVKNAKGVSVKKGALLYALPVEEEVVIEGLRELGNVHFPHYSLYGKSDWNYGLCVKDANKFSFEEGNVGEEPWRGNENGLKINVSVRQIKSWKIQNVHSVFTRRKPREKCVREQREATFTPKVRPLKKAEELGEKKVLQLVPYATTRLRIAIFPIIED